MNAKELIEALEKLHEIQMPPERKAEVKKKLLKALRNNGKISPYILKGKEDKI